jgi:hypothetical protein
MSDNRSNRKRKKTKSKKEPSKKKSKKCEPVISFYNFLLNILKNIPDVLIRIICEYADAYSSETIWKKIKLYTPHFESHRRAIDITRDEIYLIERGLGNNHKLYIYDKSKIEDKQLINDDNINKPEILIRELDIATRNFEPPLHIIAHNDTIFLFFHKSFNIIDKRTGTIIKTFTKWRQNGKDFTNLSVTSYCDKIYILDNIYDYEQRKTSKYPVYVFDKSIKKFTNKFIINLETNLSYSPFLSIVADDKKIYITIKKTCFRLYIYDFDINHENINKKFINLSTPTLLNNSGNRMFVEDVTVTNNEIFIVDRYNCEIMIFDKFTNKYIRSIGNELFKYLGNIKIFGDKIYILNNRRTEIIILNRTV